MKYAAFALAISFVLLATVHDASAIVCARGAYRAGCAGPRGAVVVHRPAAGCAWVRGVRVCR
jgi:hypothetical protein